MGSKNLTKTALGPGPLGRVANSGTRGDYSDTRGQNFKAGCSGRLRRIGRHLRGGRLRRLPRVPQHKGAAIRAAPVGANMLEIQLAPKVLFGAETHVSLEKYSGATRPLAA